MDDSEYRIILEKRKFVRLEIKINARFKLDGDQSNKIYQAVTRNISHGGLCLEINEYIDELLNKIDDQHSRLMITLDLGDPPGTVEARAKPVWLSSHVGWMQPPLEKGKPFLIGMAFDKLPEGVRDRIDTYVANKFIEIHRDGRR